LPSETQKSRQAGKPGGWVTDNDLSPITIIDKTHIPALADYDVVEDADAH
jgi:hypothetical protein